MAGASRGVPELIEEGISMAWNKYMIREMRVRLYGLMKELLVDLGLELISDARGAWPW